ncbi:MULTISPECIES: DUF975 family protein [Exiguobacterium]|uniref:Predicted integral membrane protein n=1 Tax=Exiguobacterium aurantiacum TaxID=33987 RepID=A0A377FT40_9BACL|nr:MULTISPECIES: DUF975 family protein [Exiguobacterium]TCI68659.1 DUF975 family protein [Exiguobacterium sp. IPCI3]TCI78197.1 DUF975 family protein [Exiguobacterium sp. IPCH1]TCI79339.1 DUF975 family protein [Exiguobacterium sp. IPBC4]STO07625.1 Predicted integral membrane protein [Exiguobacterium aurantiacum]
MTAQWKQHARHMLKGKWWLLAGILIVFTVLNAIPQTFAPTVDPEVAPTATETSLTLLSLLLTILIAPLTLGWSWIVLSVSRGDKPAISQLFEPFRNGYVKHVLAPLLMGIFIFLWSLLLIIPGIIKAFSYSLTYYIMRDEPELSALEAITESRRLMDGHKMQAFKLVLSFIGWFFVGILTLGIGFLFIYPYFSTAYATFYDSIQQDQRPEPQYMTDHSTDAPTGF